MSAFISVDFETRSTIDLRRSGVYPYAQHETTDIWCVAYQMPGEAEPRVWRPGDPIDRDLAGWVSDAKPLRAWNAQFERVIWNEIMARRYGWPETTIAQWFCTAADARAMSLPGTLGQAADVLGVEQQKDSTGANLMMRMARPRKVHADGTLEWWDVPDRVQRLIDYCRQDVRTELASHDVIEALPPSERAVFELDQKINDRGVRFDRELATAARTVAQMAVDRANARLQEITGGEVATISAVSQMLAWIRSRGVQTKGVAKADVKRLLGSDIPDDVREVLTLREEAGKSSVAKIESMFEAACRDDRIRGLLMYHGASTGRWSGRLVQPQNFPRGAVSDPERFIPAVLERDYDQIDFEYPVLDVVSSLLRPMMTASKGHLLVAADFSAIEARVLAWLAGEEDLLVTFRDGGDVYKVMASKIYRKPVSEIDKSERQMGKMAILGLGYGMGAKKFVDACRDMAGITVTPEEAKAVVDLYRASNAAIVQLWRDLEAAALAAVKEPGSKVSAAGKRVRFKSDGKYLWLRLPSGRKLCYPSPSVIDRVTPWGSTAEAVQVWGVNSVTRKWQATDLYSGLIAENVVQAIARDVLVEAMLRAEAEGFPVVLSVHDEIVTEVWEAEADASKLEEIMNVVPDWALGMPLASEGWSGFRYRK